MPVLVIFESEPSEPMGGAFPVHELPATPEQLRALSLEVVAEHPGGSEHLACFDAELAQNELARVRAARLQRATDAATDPLFFWPLCVAICQFTMNLLS